MEEKDRGSFSGKIGFVLAAAGSAVGLGNLWRFPYLAAKYGGGIFLLVYLILAVTFGFVIMTTEIAIGRKTQLSPLGAFKKVNKKWGFLGKLATLVPMIILPYYCVIGGWVLKYAGVMVTSQLADASKDEYFTNYISGVSSPLVFTLIFSFATALIVFFGVGKGIERISKILMPLLVVLTVVIAAYIVTRDGAMEGVIYYLKPDFSKLSIKTVVSALGQLFYSMSLAMGIMITYGSYVRKEDHIEKSVRQIEIFDTAIAFLAGLMIIPAVFIYSGGDESALNKGSGLMFITLPKVFNSMEFGSVIGLLFFILVLFAALNSCVSILEAVVSSFNDRFKLGRKKTTIIVFLIALVFSVPCSLGFGIWSDITILGFDILDFLDFISNSILMPIVAILTCVLIGFVVKPDYVISEVELNGPFKMKKFYSVIVKWIAPLFLIAILISSILEGIGIIQY